MGRAGESSRAFRALSDAYWQRLRTSLLAAVHPSMALDSHSANRPTARRTTHSSNPLFFSPVSSEDVETSVLGYTTMHQGDTPSQIYHLIDLHSPPFRSVTYRK